jgi:hypothetical protein
MRKINWASPRLKESTVRTGVHDGVLEAWNHPLVHLLVFAETPSHEWNIGVVKAFIKDRRTTYLRQRSDLVDPERPNPFKDILTPEGRNALYFALSTWWSMETDLYRLSWLLGELLMILGTEDNEFTRWHMSLKVKAFRTVPSLPDIAETTLGMVEEWTRGEKISMKSISYVYYNTPIQDVAMISPISRLLRWADRIDVMDLPLVVANRFGGLYSIEGKKAYADQNARIVELLRGEVTLGDLIR